jgi:hypothetical protein
VRILESSSVDDGFGIEDGDIGPLARPEEAAVEDSDLGGIGGSHLSNRFFQSKDLLLPDVLAEDAGEGAVVAGVWVGRLVVWSLGRWEGYGGAV